MISALKLKHNIFKKSFIILLALISKQNITNAESVKNIASGAAPTPLLEIKIIPRIRLTETNSLKSYQWWSSPSDEGAEQSDTKLKGKNNSLKIPLAFKTLLKKMKEDFLKENVNINYFLSQVNSKNTNEFEGYYLVTGNLIIDSKNKDKADLTELSFYQIKNSNLNLLFLSQTSTFTSDSSFRGLAIEFNDKINNKTYEKPDYKTSTFTIVFENELNYEELNIIKQNIRENLNLTLDQIKLHSSETNKYTFKLFVTENPFNKLKTLNFINGPYKAEIKDQEITFKTFSEEEILEP